MTFYNIAINSITKETPDCVSIAFDIPEHLKDTFVFKAGQYITLKAVINGNEVRRDYSLCSTPNGDEYKIAIKAVHDGLFSVYANSNLKAGDVIEVAPPNGRFVFEPNSDNSRVVAAFASGSGITPIMSIAKTLLEEEPNSKFILVYGNKTLKDTIFYNEILNLCHDYVDRFYLQLVLSQAEEEKALFGRIEKSTVNFIIKNKFKHLNINSFYICGPEPMINTVREVLNENDVAESSINYELFTSSVNDIIDSNMADTNGDTKITVLLDDEEITFSMSQSETILDAALDENIDAPYSCQGGVCSSCIARLTEGEATMRQNNILTDSELDEGLILTCQAQPTTSKIVVDYDDV